MKSIAITALALLISGCATRGPMELSCKGWNSQVRGLPPTALMQRIQSGANPTQDRNGDLSPNRLGKSTAVQPGSSIFNTTDFPINKSTGERPVLAGSTLLLSGGGQWGAFGTGIIHTLATDGALRGPDGKPASPFDNLTLITGVSTGGLQALLVAAGDYEELKTRYLPEFESDIVNRGGQELAVLRGSVATMEPLRAQIEEALCAGGVDQGCPMIRKIKDSKRVALIGFIDASSGQFQYVNTQAIAKEAYRGEEGPTEAKLANAQQCLTGAALASAAMPVFFQQVRIEGQTYFDGGVRRSVFSAAVIEELTSVQKGLPSLAGTLPPIYVIRNGPTTLGEAENTTIDENADALSAALTAYAMIVNEVEVQSIAGIHSQHPNRRISLLTADGYDKPFGPTGGEHSNRGCAKKNKDAMFEPEFMSCLMDYGRHKASRSEWIPLREAADRE